MAMYMNIYMTILIKPSHSGGETLYSRFVGKLNYIGHRLQRFGKKGDNVGFTLTKDLTAQLCRELAISESDLMERYGGQAGIYKDIDGKFHIWISVTEYDQDG
jgi:hypothetical protein